MSGQQNDGSRPSSAQGPGQQSLSGNTGSNSSTNNTNSSAGNRQLRRPKPSTQDRLVNGPPAGQPRNSYNSVKTVLSADAPVFVPKFSMPVQQPPAQPMVTPLPQNYRQVPPPGYPGIPPQLSVNASEFIPQRFPPQHNRPSHNNHSHSQQNFYDDFQRLLTINSAHMNTQFDAPASEQILMEFTSTLHTLTIQPGNIEEYMDPLIDLLKKVADGDIAQKMVEILFEQSITEPNFRYTGALVCKYLSKQLRNTKAFSDFRGQFLTRCKEEYLKREEMISSQDGISRLCGFTMFIGELFLNMEVEKPDGTVEKMGILRFVLRELLLTLLANPTDVTIKTASQLLKLTGATIEETVHLNKPDEGSYDTVYLRMRQLESFPNLNQTSKMLVKSVLTQKDNNWGRSLSTSSSTPSSVAPPPQPSYPNTSQQPPYSNPPPQQQNMYPQNPNTYVQNEPVFYNLQGQPISREEAAQYYQQPDYNDYAFEEAQETYARWEAGDIDDAHWGQNGYQPWSDPDFEENYDYQGVNNGCYLDEEAEAAFEEFLQLQNPRHQNR